MSVAAGGAFQAPLARFLAARIPGARDIAVEVSAEAGKAGFSAETVMFDARYVLDGEAVHRPMVLRRQIFGHDLTFDADLRLQWQAMQAMAAHSSVKVPPLVGIELDHAALGSPFLVMERLPGRIVPQNPNYNVTGWLAALPLAQRAQVWRNGIAAIAQVNRTDPGAGFGFLDNPARGARGLPQYLHWLDEWLRWALAGRRHPVAEAAMAYLHEKQPADAPIEVLWGDAIPANQLFDDGGNVVGVIDWEFAALGPGEIDLAWWLYFDELFSAGFQVKRLEGLPDRAEMIATYERAAGRAVRDLGYYELLVGLRMVIISMRSVDRIAAFGKIPADNDAWLNNPSSRWVAAQIGLPAVTIGPDFQAYIKALFGSH
jgi:aminoglycoside phosphotransferase (APT) family kinase protein